MKHYDLGTARRALERWDGDPATLEHVATSGNSVYRFRTGATDRILRLTDIAYRAPAENEAEMAFLDHLRASGVRATAPVTSRAGRAVEVLDDLSASVLTWAPGERIEPGSPGWTDAFLREWGRTLARIHLAATSYAGPPRWEWSREGLIAGAKTLIPGRDREAQTELDLVMARLSALPRRRETYGMTHADFAQQNFNFDPALGITPFDFGNCCAHWFASDIVISLSTFRRLPERQAFRDRLLEGYREVFAVPAEIWSARGWFLRLRVLYVYLSRLKKFGATPSAEERQTLELLGGMVAQSGGREEHPPLIDWL